MLDTYVYSSAQRKTKSIIVSCQGLRRNVQ